MDDPTRETAPDAAPDAAPASWRTDLATAVATGLVTTYLAVQRWSRTARWGLHGGMGAAAAGSATLLLRRPERFLGPDERDEPPARLRPAGVAAIAVGLGAAVAGASRGGEAVDAWMERTLLARGVRRPRVWMGVAAAGASLAMSAVGSKRRRHA